MAAGIAVVVVVLVLVVARGRRKRDHGRRDAAAAIVVGNREWTGPSRLRGRPALRTPRAAARKAGMK